MVSSTQAEVRCPACDVPARHIPSRYTRTLADLPWSGYRVTWRRRVRKLCCRNVICPRRLFTERLPGIAKPWARRTLRLTARLLAIGLALGGAAGVRLEPVFRPYRQSEHPLAGDSSCPLPRDGPSAGPQYSSS
jgi:transposase